MNCVQDLLQDLDASTYIGQLGKVRTQRANVSILVCSKAADAAVVDGQTCRNQHFQKDLGRMFSARYHTLESAKDWEHEGGSSWK